MHPTSTTERFHRIIAKGDQATLEYLFRGDQEPIDHATDRSGETFALVYRAIADGHVVEVTVPVSYLRRMAGEGIELSVRAVINRGERRIDMEPPIRSEYIRGFLERLDQGR